MCVKCMMGGFHDESIQTDKPKTNQQTIELSDGLLDRRWKNYMHHVGQLDDGDIDFYVDPKMSKVHKRFTKRLIKRINKLTETDIIINHNKSEADVVVETRDNYKDMGYEGAAGLAFWKGDKQYATWLTEYNNRTIKNKRGRRNPTKWVQKLITHEVLHTLGLDHPMGQGYNPDYNNEDSAMSYNMSNYGLSTALRPADVMALQTLWG